MTSPGDIAKQVKQKTKRTEAKREALSAARASIEKRYGKGTLMQYGDGAIEGIEVISSGAIELDEVLGVWGYPRGRIIEIFGIEGGGKTTLSLHAIAECQKAGGTAAFIDAEHALDPIYAQNLGVNMQELWISQPDTGEQALEICEELTRSGAVDMIVIDSVAALVPQAEIDGDMGDSHMGLQARLMSQALRKLNGIVSRTNTVLIFINQIRMKIGVMFGCFSYDSRIVLANGTTEKIGKIVNSRLPVKVRSFDPISGEIVNSHVVDWHKNGHTDKWVQFVAEKAGGNGRTQFKVTEDHLLFSPGMVEKRAGDFVVGDSLLIQSESRMNSDQLKVALSQILGDGSIRYRALTAQLRVGHGPKQEKYAQWKANIFGELVGWTNGGTHFDLIPSGDLVDFRDSPVLIPRMGLLGLALWYMDDGTFSGSFERWGKRQSLGLHVLRNMAPQKSTSYRHKHPHPSCPDQQLGQLQGQ